MQKLMDKPTKRSSEVATRVKRTAEIVGVSTRTVYRVIKGQEVDKQTIESVLSVYMMLDEGENQLLQAVKKAVPFQ